MSFDRILMWVMAIGILIGAADKISGNHLKLGDKFDEGFQAIGSLALGMVGIVCLAPVISSALGPVIVPLFRTFGADPALFGSILANDMGGYTLAMELAQSEEAGLFAGNIVASMLGCTLVFSIPVGLGLIEKEDREYFSNGLLIGLITIPIGCLIGGLIAGFQLHMLIMNTLPVLVLSALLALGLKLIPEKMIKGCTIFGQLITIVIYVGLACAAFEFITGMVIIPGMAPIMEGMEIVAGIGIVLLGTFPVLTILTKVLDKPLNAIGQKLGMDATSAAGLVFTLANSVPVYTMMKDMKKRGIIINTAWLVPATAALGDHLGFTAGVQPGMITPVVAGKLSAGVAAIALGFIMTKNMKEA
ncbi:ethanolamine transporter [Fusobacterium naviforme]|uniref:Ethanolamine transporter n=1 Tax=Moryella indoligenes TaxID=371674 RepID=A0AAE3V9P9_9FIRM|nr:ethanolamine utilization protein EutH [Moryella indoligenes]MDQ0152369.1 ethanolamine transporter [Moryella indoligenes]PSL10781.1 ethanolamine transporter [Fusobacterium naviforme]STO27332.1 ethanolamine utilization protein EutH [Fusobacterium naviforme]